MIPLWVKNRGEQITDSATFRWLAQDAGSGAVDLTLLKGSGSATFTRAGATATTVLSTGLVSSAISANTARSYYDPTTLEYLGYLAEEARTNLCIRSAELDNAAWTKTATTITANADTAPDGAATADRVVEAATLGGHFVQSTACTISAGNTVTISCFVRQGNLATSEIYLIGGGGRLAGMKFTYATATLSAATVAPVTYTISSSSVKAYPNGWYRISVVIVTSTDTSVTMQFYPLDASSYTGNTSNYSTAWGAQVEVGTFATSYIPTAAASSARAADILSFATASNILDATGSLFCRITCGSSNGAQAGIVETNGGGYPLIFTSTNNLGLYDVTAVRQFSALSRPVTTVKKVASTWGGSSCTGYIDGTPSSAATFDGSLNVSANMYFGCTNAGAENINGTIRDIRIWQRTLSDSEVQAL